MIILIEPTDLCVMCQHQRYMHVDSEYQNDDGAAYLVYEECTERACDCQMFQEHPAEPITASSTMQGSLEEAQTSTEDTEEEN